MSDLIVTAGPYRFTARLETEKAPLTCAAFVEMLPLQQSLLHVRWSGEATWVPLGDLPVALPAGNATTYPLPEEILPYAGGVSEVAGRAAHHDRSFR